MPPPPLPGTVRANGTVVCCAAIDGANASLDGSQDVGYRHDGVVGERWLLRERHGAIRITMLRSMLADGIGNGVRHPPWTESPATPAASAREVFARICALWERSRMTEC